jgi:2-hydroxychromene-2-carboxylate isomerase
VPGTGQPILAAPRALADRLARRTLPRLVVASSTVTLPARLRAQRRRRNGAPGRLELFLAFDDPCSAVAALDLAERLARREVDVVPVPVVHRGIAGDPAVALKRDYAVLDARRLAGRSGLRLSREVPLPAEQTAFLAEWIAAAEPGPALLAFTTAALRRLWFETDGRVESGEYLELWRGYMHADPQPAPAAVARCEKRMARRGPYETPAAWVAGRWYFAHDRPTQICEWLDELGWTAV